MNASEQKTTTVSLISPAGRGAVAVLSVLGPRGVEAIRRFFHPRKKLAFEKRHSDKPYYGDWISSERDYREDLIVFFRERNLLEIHCHGGELAWRQIVSDLNTADVNMEPWTNSIGSQPIPGFQDSHEEFDSVQLEAIEQLPQALTNKCAAILLDQMNGALSEQIRIISSLIEHQSTETEEIVLKLDALLDSSTLGMRLTKPWKVILVGAPNVGKSSLINALLGYERSIVFDQAGTTRDVITSLTAIDGWPIEISDTVGLRENVSGVESTGIQQTQKAAGMADMVINVIDRPEAFASTLEDGVHGYSQSLSVMNKADLFQIENLESILPGCGTILTSAKTGAGVNTLLDAIVERLVVDSHERNRAVLFTQRQIDLVSSTKRLIMEGRFNDALGELSAING